MDTLPLVLQLSKVGVRAKGEKGEPRNFNDAARNLLIGRMENGRAIQNGKDLGAEGGS